MPASLPGDTAQGSALSYTHPSTRPSYYYSQHTKVPLSEVPQLFAQPGSREASVWEFLFQLCFSLAVKLKQVTAGKWFPRSLKTLTIYEDELS